MEAPQTAELLVDIIDRRSDDYLILSSCPVYADDARDRFYFIIIDDRIVL